jgi:hypothetical protein
MSSSGSGVTTRILAIQQAPGFPLSPASDTVTAEHHARAQDRRVSQVHGATGIRHDQYYNSSSKEQSERRFDHEGPQFNRETAFLIQGHAWRTVLAVAARGARLG